MEEVFECVTSDSHGEDNIRIGFGGNTNEFNEDDCHDEIAEPFQNSEVTIVSVMSIAMMRLRNFTKFMRGICLCIGKRESYHKRDSYCMKREKPMTREGI